jgi:hypothetical protein
MIIKKCLICEVTYSAKNNKTKTCSTICGNICAAKTRRLEYDKKKPAIKMARLKPSTMTSLLKEHFGDYSSGVKISRNLWNENLKLGDYK